jgi:hypothetical protein
MQLPATGHMFWAGQRTDGLGSNAFSDSVCCSLHAQHIGLADASCLLAFTFEMYMCEMFQQDSAALPVEHLNKVSAAVCNYTLIAQGQ